MNPDTNEKSSCEHVEKQVVEGLCLSYDLVKGVCLETMEPCAEMMDLDE